MDRPLYPAVDRLIRCNAPAAGLVDRSALRMTAIYEKLGIRFRYPGNWTLDESDALEGQNSVCVYSPGGAFWSITLHPPDIDPQTLVDAALNAMRQEYQDLDAQAVRETVAGRELIGCDMNFYCLDL